jgi:hypothetical protein
MKELLTEFLPFIVTPQQLREAFEKDKRQGLFSVEGVIQRANTKNQNGRIYPKALLEREFEKYVKGPVAERRALGELDHPESGVINLKNVSHNFTKIWWEGDDVYGRMEILPTPSGNILKELFQAKITVGVSSRGMGSVRPLGENTVEVQDDFELLCIDAVSTPSTHGSFVKPKTSGSPLQEGRIMTKTHKYSQVNSLITEILCNRAGFCNCDLPGF